MTTPNEQLYLYASTFIGVKEIPGDKNNPEIMEFFRACGRKWVNSEATPWCSAAMNAWCFAVGLPTTEKVLRARSWSTVEGNDEYEVETIESVDDLRLGDLVVLWREKRTRKKKHITMFASAHGGMLNCLGGNQSNRVGIKAYPKYRFEVGKRFVRRV